MKNIKTKGFLDECSILIMTNRKDNKKDQIYQGHHRLAMAIELELSKVPVHFVTKKKL